MRRLSAKTFRLAAMTTASAAVAACGLSSAAPTNALLAGPTGRPITVGISLPLGGSPSSDPFSADGQACRIGYALWASDVNSHGGLLGRPVRLKILDDKGSEQLTQANYQTLIKTDHVDLVLAPFSSLLTIDAAKVTSKYGYALAAGSAGAPAVYALGLRSLFSTNVPASKQMVPLANYVARLPVAQRPTTAAYPMIDDPFADPPVQTAKGILSRNGIRPVYTHAKYSPNSSGAQLAQDGLHRQVRRDRLRHQRRCGRVLLGGRGHRRRGHRYAQPEPAGDHRLAAPEHGADRGGRGEVRQ